MHYKSPDNKLHFIDPEHAYLLPAGSVQITDAEAQAMQPDVDPKDVIRAEIKRMETEQLMPRATREFMLLFMEGSFTPAQLSANTGYANMKAFDNQITALRNQL